MPADTCRIVLLGACHSGADTLRADLMLALPPAHYTVCDASAAWLDAACAPPLQAQCWLLCGLDLPCPLPEQSRQQREDAELRARLAAAGLVFRVVYGDTRARRLAQALQAIDAVAPCEATARHRASAASQRLRPLCEQCSDPDCERRLFSALVR